MWKTILITCGLYTTLAEVWLSTGLLTQKNADFHKFLTKNNINLLILHQNLKLWINMLSGSLSDRKNYHYMFKSQN